MLLYQSILNNKEYLKTVQQIEKMKFITNGKWDWEHGLGHFKRVANYVFEFMTQLNCDNRMIDLAMSAALLHDIGLINGSKSDHAVTSSEMFTNFININNLSKSKIETIRHAILDHSNGKDIQSVVDLALVLADKLDITFHRTINSSIQDEMNKEIQKIQEVSVFVTETEFIVSYNTVDGFNVEILKNWPKALTIPYKVANYLNRNYHLFVNHEEIQIENFI